MRILLLLRKDLRILRRSPALAAVLVAYPLVIAGLVGLVAGYASSKPRIALVDEDHLPARVVVGNQTFDVNATIARVSRDVHLVRLSPKEAARELRTGKVVALVGPNGAGKSTLLALLAGALEPSEGAVERGEDVRIGWAPQRPAFYGRLTPRENLELFARLEGEADPVAASTRLLRAFELPDTGRAAAALSVGNRQRLNLALALLGSPRVLLLDEPTASLDAGQRRRLWEMVKGGTVVFSTQNLEEIGLYASRVVVLQRGRVTFDGAVDEYERVHAAEVFA